MPKVPKLLIACEHFTWSLFQRGGVFYADGRRIKPSLGKHSLATRSRDEALTNLSQLDRRKAIELGIAQPISNDKHHSLSIADGWQNYLAFCSRPTALGGVALATQKRYRAVRDKHQQFCAEQGIADWNSIDRKSVLAYGEWLAKQGYSDASLYLECTLLKQLVKWLIEEFKSLPESHRIRLQLQRSEQSDCYCYSREEVQAMLGLCRSSPHLTSLADIITALACTGMRIGELIHLQWTDVDLGSGVITVPYNRHSGRSQKFGTVRTTKGRRTRRIPIHSDLRPVLKRLQSKIGGRVFVGPNGGLMKADIIRNTLVGDVLTPLKDKFPTAAGEIGFLNGRLHSFRHFFVSQAFLGGASEGEIREWVGHRNSRIVERYRHLRSEDARRKMDRLQFLTTDAQNNNCESDVSTNTQKQNCDSHESGVPIRRDCKPESEVPASAQQQQKIRDDDDQKPEAA